MAPLYRGTAELPASMTSHATCEVEQLFIQREAAPARTRRRNLGVRHRHATREQLPATTVYLLSEAYPGFTSANWSRSPRRSGPVPTGPFVTSEASHAPDGYRRSRPPPSTYDRTGNSWAGSRRAVRRPGQQPTAVRRAGRGGRGVRAVRVDTRARECLPRWRAPALQWAAQGLRACNRTSLNPAHAASCSFRLDPVPVDLRRFRARPHLVNPSSATPLLRPPRPSPAEAFRAFFITRGSKGTP